MKKQQKSKSIKVFCVSTLSILLAATVLLISGCNNPIGQQGNENEEIHSVPEPVALSTEDPDAIIERGVTVEDVNQALAKIVYIIENSRYLFTVHEGIIEGLFLPNDIWFKFKSICGIYGSETIDLQHELYLSDFQGELNISKDVFPYLKESTIIMDYYPISLNYSRYSKVGDGDRIGQSDRECTIPVPLEIMQAYAKSTGIQFDNDQISFPAITPEFISECSDPEPLFRFLTSIANMMESTEITDITENNSLEMR